SQCGAAHTASLSAIAEEATTTLIETATIGMSGGDDDAVDAGAGRDGRRGAVQLHHVIRIVAHDVDRVCHHAARIGDIVTANVAAENGGVVFPFALVALSLVAGKAAIEGDTRRDIEAITTEKARRVDALSHPDFVHMAAEVGYQQRVPQAGKSVVPGTAIARASG